MNQVRRKFCSKVGGVLYIPSQKLIFTKHQKHGLVCPIYIADNEYNRKNDPKKIMPAILFFSGLNFYFLLTGWGYVSVGELYRMFYFNNYAYYVSLAINIAVVRKYLQYLSDYTNRVKNLYLLPGGERLIMETFDGSVFKLSNLEIYERQIMSKKDNDAVLANNENSFFARIAWGAGKEHFFDGKLIYLNYDIFTYIIHRHKIDTTQSRFIESPLKFWTKEDKVKILKKFGNRIIPQRIKINKLYYYFLKKKYLPKPKPKTLKKEMRFYDI
jgi:hypothetical protein